MLHGADRKSEPIWEKKAPLILFGIGLLILLIAAFAVGGPRGTAGALIALAIILALYLPLTVAAMYIVAGILGVSFGILKTAILKLAAITLFTAAIDQVGAWVGLPVTGFLVAVAASFFLFSYFFDLDARDTILSVILISVLRWCLGLVVAVMVAALVAPVM